MAAKTTAGTECQAHVSTGWSGGRACGNPAKGTLADGKPACGVHLAAQRKRAQKEEEYQRRRAQELRLQKAAGAACDRLAEVGIFAKPEWDGNSGGYTGMIVTSPGEILAAIMRAVEGPTDMPEEEGRDGNEAGPHQGQEGQDQGEQG